MEHLSNLVLIEFVEVIIFCNTQGHIHSLHHNVYLYPHMYHVSCIMHHVSYIMYHHSIFTYPHEHHHHLGCQACCIAKGLRGGGLDKGEPAPSQED